LREAKLEDLRERGEVSPPCLRRFISYEFCREEVVKVHKEKHLSDRGSLRRGKKLYLFLDVI
jgi:hypothetical protein